VADADGGLLSVNEGAVLNGGTVHAVQHDGNLAALENDAIQDKFAGSFLVAHDTILAARAPLSDSNLLAASVMERLSSLSPAQLLLVDRMTSDLIKLLQIK